MRILNAELEQVLKISKQKEDDFFEQEMEHKEPEVTKPEIELKHEEDVQMLRRPKVMSIIEKLNDFQVEEDPDTGKPVYRNPHFDKHGGEPIVLASEEARDSFIKYFME